ncbi:hypothetical protein A9Q84_01690 [Halobacteriovorax marinus]|uniref:Uncharacterized protein n=1 Tax=Halobacteriovorax marinus TaxID=97084 RepID=A0A1Y5FHU9_9BACT|nr:hypothetical protein A9Q84_01690 [Halobacteriovorax marinus]
MKQLLTYFKLQYKLFLTLILLVIVPLVLVYLFSPYEWDNLYWLALTFIFALKVVFYKEAPLKKKLIGEVRERFISKTGKVPSKMQIVRGVDEIIVARDVMLVSVGVCVLIVTLFFGKL